MDSFSGSRLIEEEEERIFKFYFHYIILNSFIDIGMVDEGRKRKSSCEKKKTTSMQRRATSTFRCNSLYMFCMDVVHVVGGFLQHCATIISNINYMSTYDEISGYYDTNNMEDSHIMSMHDNQNSMNNTSTTTHAAIREHAVRASSSRRRSRSEDNIACMYEQHLHADHSSSSTNLGNTYISTSTSTTSFDHAHSKRYLRKTMSNVEDIRELRERLAKYTFP